MPCSVVAVSVEVKPVRSRQDRREFIELPFRLHATSEQWVPPIRLERRLFHSRRMNAYFKHAEAQEFVARRDARVVGRISAQVDRGYDDEHGPGTGMFGFLELEDDADVAPALLDAARGWLRDRGRSHMIGPMDYTMNDECGVLIEGFDREPMIKQPWHPPYYRQRVEEAGLQKAVDLYMWALDISDREKILPVIFELAEQAVTKHGITLRHLRRRDLSKNIKGVFGEVYNAAWKRNWGFVPYSDDDLKHYAEELQLVYDRNWFMTAEKDGETIGIAITVPDVNQLLKVMNGNVFPLGWFKFLFRRDKYIDRVRVGFLGVKPEYQHTGTAALFYVEHFDMARVTPQKWGEMGWILETNRAMNRGMEAMGGRIAKRFRVYESRF
jgi:GNAT superfamily N-acetyltransferase